MVAISDYQSEHRLTVSGMITEELLESLGLVSQTEDETEGLSPKQKEQSSSKAILKGKMLAVVDGEYYVSDINLENDWLNLCDTMGKGYGITGQIINLVSDQGIPGGEGAEIYLPDQTKELYAES